MAFGSAFGVVGGTCGVGGNAGAGDGGCKAVLGEGAIRTPPVVDGDGATNVAVAAAARADNNCCCACASNAAAVPGMIDGRRFGSLTPPAAIGDGGTNTKGFC